MMSLFGITEQGFAKIKIGVKPEIWAYGLRNPYMFHFDKQVRRSLHRRRRPEPLGGDQLAAGLSQGRRELRLEAQHGLELPSVTGADRQLPDRRRASGRRVSTPGAVSGGGEVEGRLGLLGARPRRRELRRHDKAYLVGDWCSGRLWGVGWDGRQ